MAVEDLDLPSPCVGICRLEPETGLCVGYLRTGGEMVAALPSAALATRLEILTALQARRGRVHLRL